MVSVSYKGALRDPLDPSENLAMLAKKKLRQCLACDVWFAPSRPNQAYHDDACRRRNAKRKDSVRSGYDLPPPLLLNRYISTIRRSKVKDAIGYILYCQELDLYLPVPCSLRRDGHRPKTNFFTLNPIEIPLVPLKSSYKILWVFHLGLVYPTTPPQFIYVEWADDMRRHGEVGKRLRLYNQQQALAGEPRRIDFEHFVRVVHSPPEVLTPQGGGESGSGDDSAE